MMALQHVENATETTAAPVREYRIPVENLARLDEKLAKVNKRAAKLGQDPMTYTQVREEQDEERDAITGLVKAIHHYAVIVLDGSLHVGLPGWQFIATIEHAGEDGNLVHEVPGAAQESELLAYRTTTPYCDHCHTSRRRIETFIVRLLTDNSLKQVGRNCLTVFLGVGAEELAARAEWLSGVAALFASEEHTPGTGARMTDFGTAYVLALTAQMVRCHGWLGKGKAYDEGRMHDATAVRVLDILTHRCMHGAAACHDEHADITAADEALAQAALEWVQGTLGAKAVDDRSDYEHNLVIATKGEAISDRHLGLVCSAIASYNRTVSQEREQAATANLTHVGTVGKREVFTLTLLDTRELESNFGVTTLCKFADGAGNQVVWFASGWQSLEIGHTYQVKATVKAHGDFRGVPQTTITRAKVEQSAASENTASENARKWWDGEKWVVLDHEPDCHW